MVDERLNPDSPLRNYSGEIFDCVVMDGSNIITQNIPTTRSSRRKFNANRLIKTLNHIHNLGWPTYLGMKKGTYRFAVSSKKSTLTTSDREILDDLIDRGILSLIEDKNDDDWLIRAAMQRNGWVLSNDRYLDAVRKLVQEKDYDLANEINRRSCRLEWVGSEPLFVLPKNNSAMEKTEIVSNKLYIKEKIDHISNINFQVYYDKKPIASITLPVNTPIGRKDFASLDKEYVSTISRVHFIIERSPNGELNISDLDSKNGTIVNELSIAPNYSWKLSSETKNIINIGKLQLETTND
jgi:hypothetical protein